MTLPYDPLPAPPVAGVDYVVLSHDYPQAGVPVTSWRFNLWLTIISASVLAVPIALIVTSR